MELNDSQNKKMLPRIEWALFVLAIAWYGWFLTPLPNWNVNSRADLASSIVLDHKVTIDRYFHNSSDIACVNGHYYSDKAPGSSWMALPWLTIYSFKFVVEPINIWQGYLLTFFVVSLPSAFLAVLLFRYLFLSTNNPGAALIATVTFAFGSIAFPYATLFYSHMPATIILFLLYLIGNRCSSEPDFANYPACAAFGFLQGALFVTEQQLAPAGAAIGLYFLWNIRSLGVRHVISRLAAAAAAAAIPVCCWLSYNSIIFHRLVDFGYHYECIQEFKRGMTRGIGGFEFPRISTLFDLYFSAGRGLFATTPVFLLAIPGLYIMFRNKSSRSDAALITTIIIITALWSACVYQPEGGASLGPRYLLSMLPFCSVAMAVPLARERPFVLAACAGFTFVSVLQMLIGTITNPQVPRGIQAAFGQYTLPMFLDGYIRPGVLMFVSESYVLQILPPLFVSVICLFIITKEFRRRVENKTNRASRRIILSFILAAVLFGSLTYSLNMREAALHPAQSHTAMGDTYRFLKMRRMSRKHYEKALKSNPGEAKAHFGIGMIEYADGNVIHGLEHFMSAARMEPTLSEAHYNIGVIEFAAGHDETAARSLILSADTDRAYNVYRSAAALTTAAGIYLKSGRINEAAALIDRALNLVPNNRNAELMRDKIERAMNGNKE